MHTDRRIEQAKRATGAAQRSGTLAVVKSVNSARNVDLFAQSGRVPACLPALLPIMMMM